MEYIGWAALPLSLLAVGAGLKFAMDQSQSTAVLSSSLTKLILLPTTSMFLLSFMGVSGSARAVALLYFAVPCAGNAYILARQMRGDAEVMLFSKMEGS